MTFVILMAAVACTEETAVRLGLLVDLDTNDGPITVRTVRLAVGQVNEAGGLQLRQGRRMVELLVKNTHGNPEVASRVALKLINQEGVVALIGPSRSLAAIPVSHIANEARVSMISPSSTHPATTRDKPFVFRVTYTDTVQASALAGFARRELQTKTAAVIYDVVNEYSEGLAESFRDAFLKAGGEVVAFESFVSGAEDWSDALGRIRDRRPEVLFLPSFTPTVVRQAKQARALGISATLLGGDSWTSAVLTGHPELDGAFHTVAWHQSLAAGNPQAQAFLEAYRKVWGEPYKGLPTPVFAYDAAGLVLQALRDAGRPDPEAIRDALAKMVGYPGATGSVTYRGTGGDPPRQGIILQLRDGKAQLVGEVPGIKPVAKERHEES